MNEDDRFRSTGIASETQRRFQKPCVGSSRIDARHRLMSLEYLHSDFGAITITVVTAFADGGFVTNFTHPDRLTNDLVGLAMSDKIGGLFATQR